MKEWDLDKLLHYVSLLLEQLARLLPLLGETAEMSQVLLYKESTHSLASLYIVEMKEMGRVPCTAIQFCYKRNIVPKIRNFTSLLPHSCSGVLIAFFTELRGPPIGLNQCSGLCICTSSWPTWHKLSWGFPRWLDLGSVVKIVSVSLMRNVFLFLLHSPWMKRFQHMHQI